MLLYGHSVAVVPVFRQYRRCHDALAVFILFHRCKALVSTQVKQVHLVLIIPDTHSLKTELRIPVHHGKETFRKGFAGDLPAFSVSSLDHAPADRISCSDLTGAHDQLLFRRIDQELHIGRVFKRLDAGIVKGDAAYSDSHRRVKAV